MLPSAVREGLRQIGPISEVAETAQLLAPLVLDQSEPYPGVAVTRDLAYGPDPLHRLDVFAPAKSASERPVLVHAHGGGFQRGDKRETAVFYDNVMVWAARRGMVGVNLNYRLAPENRWPAAHEDFAAALRWTAAEAARFGGDPARLYLIGCSAGACLIAGYLALPRFRGPETAGVRGAILLSGVYDEEIFAATPYFDGLDDPELVAAGFAFQGLQRSPAPLLLGCAELDTARSLAQARALAAALEAAGRPARLAVFPGHSHTSQMFSFNTPDDSVSGSVLHFVDACENAPGLGRGRIRNGIAVAT